MGIVTWLFLPSFWHYFWGTCQNHTDFNFGHRKVSFNKEIEGYLTYILVQKWTPHTPICSHIFSCFSCVFSYQVGDTNLKVFWQHCVSYLFSPVFQIHLALWTLLFTLINSSSLFPTWIDPGLHTAFWKVVYKYCWIHLQPEKETKEHEYELSLTLTRSKTQKFTEKNINIF